MEHGVGRPVPALSTPAHDMHTVDILGPRHARVADTGYYAQLEQILREAILN